MSPPPAANTSSPNNTNSTFKNPLSSGLGRGGRMAAWAVAIGVVAAWNYYDNQKNTSDTFTVSEQESWNAQKKKKDASTPSVSNSN